MSPYPSLPGNLGEVLRVVEHRGGLGVRSQAQYTPAGPAGPLEWRSRSVVVGPWRVVEECPGQSPPGREPAAGIVRDHGSLPLAKGFGQVADLRKRRSCEW